MKLHAKVTHTAITLQGNTSRFLFSALARLYSQLNIVRLHPEPPGSCPRLSRCPPFCCLSFRFPPVRLNFRSPKVRAHGKLRSIDDLEANLRFPLHPI